MNTTTAAPVNSTSSQRPSGRVDAAEPPCRFWVAGRRTAGRTMALLRLPPGRVRASA